MPSARAEIHVQSFGTTKVELCPSIMAKTVTDLLSSGAITTSVAATILGLYTICVLWEKGDRIRSDLVTNMDEFNILAEKTWSNLMVARNGYSSSVRRSERQAYLRCNCNERGGKNLSSIRECTIQKCLFYRWAMPTGTSRSGWRTRNWRRIRATDRAERTPRTSWCLSNRLQSRLRTLRWTERTSWAARIKSRTTRQWRSLRCSWTAWKTWTAWCARGTRLTRMGSPRG